MENESVSPLEKLIMKKRESGKVMDPLEQKAKMGNLASLRDEMSSMMKGDLAPKAEVSVAVSDPEGMDVEQDATGGSEMGDDDSDGDSIGGDPSMGGNGTGKDADTDMVDQTAGSPSTLTADEIDQLQMLLGKLKSTKLA